MIPSKVKEIAYKAFGWCNGNAGTSHLDSALDALDEAGYIRTEPDPDNPVDKLRRSGW
jgi:hypothetical protein